MNTYQKLRAAQNLLAEVNEELRITEAKLRRASNNKKRLTPREVRNIRELHKQGESQRALATDYDVNPATISRIVRGIYHAL